MSFQLNCVFGNQQITCNLSWSGSQPSGLIDYIIFYYESGSSQINSKSTSLNSVVITGLTNDVVYNFYAVAYLTGQSNGQSLSETSVVQSVPGNLPSAPTNLAVEVSSNGNVISQEAILTWTASTTDSYYPILNYNVYQSTDNVTFTLVDQPTGLTQTILNLVNGTTYYFEVSATNAIGEGLKCSSVSGLVSGLASAPQNLVVNFDAQASQSAQTGYQKVDITFNAPSSNGGNAIASYNIEYSLDNTFATGVTTANVASTSDTIQNSSLMTPFADLSTSTGWYFFRVCAVTSLGNGLFSSVTTINSDVPPVAVQNLTSSNLDSSGNHAIGTVSLNWAYAIDNSCPLLGYICTYLDYLNHPQSVYIYEPNSAPNLTITGLENGHQYTFNVMAMNLQGMSPNANVLQIPSSIPDSPVLSLNGHTSNSISILWTAPNDNGSALTGYNVLKSTDGVNFSVIASNVQAQSYTDSSGLVLGTTYYYEVEAINANGDSLPSNIVNDYPSQIGSPPSSLSVVNSNGASTGNQLTLSFTETLANDGGSLPISYNIYRSDNYALVLGSVTAIGSDTTYQYVDNTALNAHTYAYKVSMINRDGESALSVASNSQECSGLPDAPNGLALVVGNDQLALSWNLLTANSNVSPADEGSAVLNYKIYRDGTYLNEVNSSTSSYVDSGLQNGVSHSYTVSALNANGEGSQSLVVTNSSATFPDVPASLNALHNVGGGAVTVSWNLLNTAPYPATSPSDEGRSIITYNIYQSTDNVSFAMVAQVAYNLTEKIISGLTNGTTYYYKISATNSIGEGNLSSSVNVIPSTSPSVVNNVVLVPSDTQLEISFSAPTISGGLPYTYNVELVDASGNVDYSSSGTTNLHFVATALLQQTQYTLKIYGNNGVDTNYNIYTANSQTMNVPDPISDLQYGANLLSWSAPTGLLNINEFLLVIFDVTNPQGSSSVSIASNTQYNITNNTYSYQFVISPQNAENANLQITDTMKIAMFAINNVGVSPISNVVQAN